MTDTPERPPPGPAAARQHLERERLRVYRDGAVDGSGRYIPTVAVILTVLLASHDLGQGLATFVVTQACLIALVVAVVIERRRRGVTALRLRGMPSSLRRCLLPLVMGGAIMIVLTVAVFGWALVGGEPSFTLLGLVCGTTLGVTGTRSWRRFASEAERLATEAGLAR